MVSSVNVLQLPSFAVPGQAMQRCVVYGNGESVTAQQEPDRRCNGADVGNDQDRAVLVLVQNISQRLSHLGSKGPVDLRSLGVIMPLAAQGSQGSRPRIRAGSGNASLCQHVIG